MSVRTTYAWQDVLYIVNEFCGFEGEHSVTLEKYEKKWNEAVTDTPVSNAEFYLFHINGLEEIQIGSIWTTDKNGQIYIQGLPVGSYFFYEVKSPENYEFDKADGAEIRKYYFTVTEEDVSVTAYNVRKTGSLLISKSVENKDESSLKEWQQYQQFAFQVKFSDGGSYPYLLNNEGEELYPDDNSQIYLKHGDTAYFHNLPAGVTGYIDEIPVEGYISYSNITENSIIIPSDGIVAEVEFMNIYDSYDLELSKEVTGDVDQSMEFEFTVSLGEDETKEYWCEINGEFHTIRSGEMIYLKAGQTAVISGLPAGLEYHITEENFEESGYAANFRKISGVITSDSNPIIFENRKIKEQTGSLSVEKIVSGREEGEQFQFRITFSDGNQYSYQMDGTGSLYETDNGIFYLKANERAVFHDVPEGVTFLVEELSDNAEFISLIDSVNGTVVAQKTAEVSFHNYRRDETSEQGEGSLSIYKNTNAVDADMEFEFKVTFSDGYSYPYQRNGQGEWAYPQEGIVRLGAGDYVLFSEMPEGVKFRIEELEYPDWSASINTITGTVAAEVEVKAEFYNYKRQEQTGSLEISKEISGSAANKQDEFLFQVVFEDGGNYAYRIGGEVYEYGDGVISLRAGETAVFDTIPDRVKYTIEEIDSGEGYTAKVKSYEGTISAGFTNTAPFHNYKAETTTLVVKKVVEGSGADWTKKFSFVARVDGKTEHFSLAHGEEWRTILPEGAIYQVTEKDDPDRGYVQAEAVNSSVRARGGTVYVTITNIYTPVKIERTSVTARKIWEGARNPNQPVQVAIQLLADGVPYGDEIILSKQNNWQHTWIGLDKSMVWTVEELTELADYETVITGNVVEGFVIKNIYKWGNGSKDNENSSENANENTDLWGSRGNGKDGKDQNEDSSEHETNEKSRADAATGDSDWIYIWLILAAGSLLLMRWIRFYKEE